MCSLLAYAPQRPRADLDTLASSIAFAYLSAQKDDGRSFVPLQITPADKLKLRQENLQALSYASIDDPRSVLLTSDLLGGVKNLHSLGEAGASFALVDHNQLLGMFGPAKVVSVIDHHEPAADDTLFRDADPRIIQVPTGSCSSLVALYFKSTLPPHVPVPAPIADLLLSACIIDTGDLKQMPKGKATKTDNEAAAWLAPFSNLFSNVGVQHVGASDPSQIAKGLADAHDRLSSLKADVSSLTSEELLERDYKQYSSKSGWAWGLSTVPLGLKQWKDRKGKDMGGGWEGLLQSLEDYVRKNQLDAGGILTSFTDDDGKHKRQVVLLVLDAKLEPLFDQLPDDQAADGAEELSLEPLKDDPPKAASKEGRMCRIWRMRNTKATRKQVGPRLQRLIEALPSKA